MAPSPPLSSSVSTPAPCRVPTNHYLYGLRVMPEARVRPKLGTVLHMRYEDRKEVSATPWYCDVARAPARLTLRQTRNDGQQDLPRSARLSLSPDPRVFHTSAADPLRLAFDFDADASALARPHPTLIVIFLLCPLSSTTNTTMILPTSTSVE